LVLRGLLDQWIGIWFKKGEYILVVFKNGEDWRIIMKIVFMLLVSIMMLFSCDLSGLFEGNKNSNPGFKEIFASVRPVYIKTFYNEWDKRAWLKFKNAEYEWYDYSDKLFTGRTVFRASINAADIESKAGQVLIPTDTYCPGNCNISHSVYFLTSNLPVSLGRTFGESLRLIEDLIGNNLRPVSTYALGESIVILLPEINVRNYHVMPQKEDIEIENTLRFGFAVKLRHQRIYTEERSGGERDRRSFRNRDYSYHIRNKFDLNYSRKHVYYPQNIVVFDEITCVLNDKASLVNFYPSNMIESHEVNGGVLVLTMADHDDLKTPHVGHLFDAVIRAEDGTTRTINFNIHS